MGPEGASPALSDRSFPRELVCLGLATADTIVELAGWPTPDGRFVVSRIESAYGGPAATAAVAAARLGRSVAFAGVVGEDELASGVRAGLAGAGVDDGQLSARPGSTPRSVILVDSSADTRTILHAPGVAGEPLSLSAAGRDLCLAAKWVHVDHAGWVAAVAADIPRRHLSVDGGNPIPSLELAGVGLYAPSASALHRRYGGAGTLDAARRALAEGAEVVVVTLAGGGALAATRDAAWRVAAASVEVASTLGAGDVFHGALLAALLNGCELPESLRRANLAAALSCRALDGRGAIPTVAELHAGLASSPPVERISLEEDR